MSIMRVQLALLSMCVLAGCEAPPTTSEESVTVLVPAEAGGRIALRNGTVLSIPPGALASDTEITVTGAPPGSITAEGLRGGVVLEPEGLTFLTPATLTLPFDAAGLEEPDDLVVVMGSSLNVPRNVGGDIDASVIIEDAVRDGDRMIIPVPHFTVFSLVYFPKMYIAPIIPGRYLRPGDILYTLTGGVRYIEATTMPIHVGLFAGGDTVIESTVRDTACTPTIFEGVDEHPYFGDRTGTGLVHLCGGHVFIGARRPNAHTTPEQGQAAVRAARAHVRATEYGIMGASTPVTGMTCVQLAETAWEQAGVNMVGPIGPLLTPANQLGNTTAVREITIELRNAPVRIPIAASVRVHRATYTAGGSTPGRIPMELTLTGPDTAVIASGRARLEEPQLLPGDYSLAIPAPQAVRDLVLDPEPDDVGFTWLLDLDVTVPSMGVTRRESRFLRVRIEGSTPQACPEVHPVTGMLTFDGAWNGTAGANLVMYTLDYRVATRIGIQRPAAQWGEIGISAVTATVEGVRVLAGSTYRAPIQRDPCPTDGGYDCATADAICPPDALSSDPYVFYPGPGELAVIVSDDCRTVTATATANCREGSLSVEFTGTLRE